MLHDCNEAAIRCQSPGVSVPCERHIDACSIWYQLNRRSKFYHILNKPQLWIIHELQSQTEHSSQLISIESCSILTTANRFLYFVCSSFERNWSGLMRYVPLEPPLSFRSICSQFARTGGGGQYYIIQPGLWSQFVIKFKTKMSKADWKIKYHFTCMREQTLKLKNCLRTGRATNLYL